MNARNLLLLSTLLAAATLTACGGGGAAGGSNALLPTGGGATTQSSQQQQTEDAINTANDVGTPMKDFSSYDESTGSPAQGSFLRTQDVARDAVGSGTCSNGVEFFAPDKNGDANSTERIDFYDNGCTAMARDAVRIYTPSGAASETVQRTVSLYAMNSTSPAAVRSETVNYTNATFDQYGYPVLKNGFGRTHTGELSVSGVKTIDADGEFLLEPSSANSATFCSDSAGFNATGDAALSETFGWAGVMPNGTRTVNNDGSVTWQTAHNGSTYIGAIGGFSIQAGVQNASCPIATPMFTLAGGTVKGQYTLPVTATYNDGILTNLTIQNATLANGETLNVQTNTGVAPGDPHFISGTLAKSAGTIASFNVDAFGDGVLVVASSGKQYQIEDWHVVKV